MSIPKTQRQIQRKLKVLAHAAELRNVSKTCRYFGVSRDTFYEWKKAFKVGGEPGLIYRKRGPRCNLARRVPIAIEEKILHLRGKYHFGPQRIVWYLMRYHATRVSTGGVYQVLRRNGMNRLPKNCPVRTIPSKRYEKQVPGHHVQIDVKFLKFIGSEGKTIKRFQYTAIDDATRIRALKIYPRHNQRSAIDFVNYVVEKFPFRIHTIRTDNGHEFQAQFHWHVEDLGMRHSYIKPRTPRLNGKVERSHGTDEREFYQLLTYTDDVDLSGKLTEWESFYNLHRPHGGLHGKTPFEVLQEKLTSTPICQVMS
jgi:transposase InsO family protein